MCKIQNIITFVLFSAVLLHAQDKVCLKFPVQKGKIIRQDTTSIIRLVEAEGAPAVAEAIFLVKGSPAACYGAVSDFGEYPEFMPNMIHTAPASPKNQCVWDFALKVAAWKLRYRLAFTSAISDTLHRLSWRYVSGDLKDSKGTWEIRPCRVKPGYSVVYYTTASQPSVAAPRWVIDLLTTKSIPGLIEAVRQRVATVQAGTPQISPLRCTTP